MVDLKIKFFLINLYYGGAALEKFIFKKIHLRLLEVV